MHDFIIIIRLSPRSVLLYSVYPAFCTYIKPQTFEGHVQVFSLTQLP